MPDAADMVQSFVFTFVKRPTIPAEYSGVVWHIPMFEVCLKDVVSIAIYVISEGCVMVVHVVAILAVSGPPVQAQLQ